MSTDAPVFIGIDVSKEWMDVAVRPTGDTWRVNQGQEGIDALILQFQSLDPQCVVMEATGGYEMLSIALGGKLDAAVIAHFGEVSGVVELLTILNAMLREKGSDRLRGSDGEHLRDEIQD